MALQKLDRRFDSDPRLDKSRNPDGLRLFHPADGRAWRQRAEQSGGPVRQAGRGKGIGQARCGRGARRPLKGAFLRRPFRNAPAPTFPAKKRTPKRGFVFCRGGRIAFPIVSDGLRRVSPRARQSCLKKSLPLSSTRMKAGKFSTSIFQTASIPSSGYSTSSTFLMLSCARIAAGPPMEPR